MVKIASSQNNPQVKEGVVEVSDDEFKTLTAEEAAAWRLSHPQASPWHVLFLQIGIGALMVVLTGLLTREFHLAASVAWGCVSVVIPSVVFIRALSRQMRQIQPRAVLMGLFFWELVKIILTVALLLVAPKVISNLSWLALVAGFVVTIKVYWLAMALGYMQQKSKPTLF
ncbi:ATP synthase subunit I [Limnohabitans sp.]|jgi:ATP synthase protein I|uniref:ATP synthase subunit I n=1 Tax=Limnohabitans sp. TaxID=1907725 RepID=UPI0037C0B5A7